MREFDKDKQYGDFQVITDNHSKTIKIAKRIMMSQMRKCVPRTLRHLVKGFTKHFDAEMIKIKEDNYKMLGETKAKIGSFLIVPECWLLCWKYSPLQKGSVK